MSGHYYCQLCEMAGRPIRERFRAAGDEAGRTRMEQHVLEPHPAQARANVAVMPGGELVDVALTDGGDR